MAGGSTDAAAVLVGMNRLFGLGLGKKELMRRGVKLGADIPYCILRGTALSEGIGEILTELPPAPQCHVVLAKPQISVSTKAVYEKLRVDALGPEAHRISTAWRRPSGQAAWTALQPSGKCAGNGHDPGSSGDRRH